MLFIPTQIDFKQRPACLAQKYHRAGWYAVKWLADQGNGRDVIQLQVTFKRRATITEIVIAKLFPTFGKVADHFKNRAINVYNQSQLTPGFDVPQNLKIVTGINHGHHVRWHGPNNVQLRSIKLTGDLSR